MNITKRTAVSCPEVDMKRVVIIGAGFGGLRAARGLAGKGFEVWLLDRQNYHLFQPLLYQVATASLDEDSIAQPVRSIVRGWDGVQFRLTEVEGVDAARRQIITREGPFSYDYLVVAAGAATAFFGLNSAAEHAYELKGLDDAIILRNRILSAFERALLEDDPALRRALLTFVVIGGGPTGVEFAGALAELVNRVLVKDYPRELIDETRIVLVEMAPYLLAPYAEKQREYARRRLERMGVEVRLGSAVKDVLPDRVVLDDGSDIPSFTVLWAAGVEAAPLAGQLPAERARGGRVPVQPDLTLPGHPEIYVIGDMAYMEQDGQPLPQMAPVAMQMGEYVARHIVARERGRSIPPFRYRDRGSMAVIGRSAAVARIFGRRFRGFIAWVIWLVLHLLQLIDFRNRLLVVISWAYDYLLFERKVGLIMRAGTARPLGPENLLDTPIAGSEQAGARAYAAPDAHPR